MALKPPIVRRRPEFGPPPPLTPEDVIAAIARRRQQTGGAQPRADQPPVRLTPPRVPLTPQETFSTLGPGPSPRTFIPGSAVHPTGQPTPEPEPTLTRRILGRVGEALATPKLTGPGVFETLVKEPMRRFGEEEERFVERRLEAARAAGMSEEQIAQADPALVGLPLHVGAAGFALPIGLGRAAGAAGEALEAVSRAAGRGGRAAERARQFAREEPPVPSGGVPRAAKEPWEMTQAEFFETPQGKPTVSAPINVKHRAAVTQALAEGKPVPPEVLRDYPDLAAQAARAAPEEAARAVPAEPPPVVYHGSPKVFETFDPGKANADALYGPGAYFTESPEVAKGYSRTVRLKPGEVTEPNVVGVKLSAKKPFDIDAAADPVLVKKIQGFQDDNSWPRSLDNATDARTNGDLYDILAADLGKADANDWLVANGFDSITHIGGQRTGTPPHRVWIALGDDAGNVEQQITRVPGAERPPVAPEALPAPAGAARGAIPTSELPERARMSVLEQSAMERTNIGGSIDAPDPYAGAMWQKTQVPIEDLRQANPEIFDPAWPGYRGSRTEGPGVILADGNIIDGTNRAFEAIRRGDTHFTAFKQVKAVSPTAEAARTPTQATQQVKAVHQAGQSAPEAVPAPAARQAHTELAAPDGPKPPTPPEPPPGGRPPPDEPSDIMRQITDVATEGEQPTTTLLRRHSGAIAAETLRIDTIVKEGNTKLKALGIGATRRGQLVPRTEDIPKLDELFNALNNPSKVASGEIRIPQGFEEIYRDLRGRTDWTTASMLDFDPAAATIEDYFYRGWKPPEGAFEGVIQGRPLVKTPSFRKPRVDATYQEMRDAGFEPRFWNPYQQWATREIMGMKYREQMKLVEYMKGLGEDFARPHGGGPIPQGWRVPEVGPAFEGKPFATLDAAGEPTTMFTRRWIVPDRAANGLENIYGKRPNLGKLHIGPKTIDPLAVIDAATFLPKRAKLFASFFQQMDFLRRAGAGSWTRMVDAMFAGQPIEAVTALARYPKTAATIIRANFSPGARQSLVKQLQSTKPLVEGRPGVNLNEIVKGGLSTKDPSMFNWADMDKVVREVAQETGILAKGRAAVRVVEDLESAMRRGLFDGVYPAAMITDIENNVAPMLARMYPNRNDAQLSGMIARIINTKYSSIPASQSVVQNRVLRETLRRVFFSMGESEGLLKQAAGTIAGPNKKFWLKHWLGTYLFLLATAEAVHYASTGEHLPVERFMPISKNKYGPMPWGYNTQTLAPTIPLKGRGGAELTWDVVAQMDTAFRLFNPGFFATSRVSVPLRALINQLSGTDFFGTPINDVGPWGVLSRTAQLARDLFSPIGVGGLAEEVARRNIPGAERIIAEGETRLGLPGLAIQATGENIRAATREQRLRSTFGDDARTTLSTLDNLGMDLGYVTRRFDTRRGKGGEITLTSEQREQLQWLTDDTVVQGLARLFASSNFQKRSKQQQKELTKKLITDLRAQARGRFRIELRGQQRQEPVAAPTPRPAPAPTRPPTTPQPATTPSTRSLGDVIRDSMGEAAPQAR